MAEASVRPARSSPSFEGREGRRPSAFRKWFAVNWTTIAILAFIFFVALFLRAYFGYEMSADNGYIVSGGSDSYYWQRIIDHNVNTGEQLYWDPMLNYPEGARNPRPPMYSMSVAVPAVALQFLFDTPADAAGEMLIWSTAIWGALTIFPTYFLGKESFGRRAGLMAALFLAIMPSHIQRSVITNADHDAFILFWIVVTFYFLLRALKTQQAKRWVENWRSFSSVKSGLAGYFRESRTSVMYSLMAGMALACVIMAWVGFGYAAVIILTYYLIQVVLNRFKNVDSTGVTITILIIMAFAYLISFPVYYEQNLIAVRFDVPVYLFLGAIAIGALFVFTRDVPWTLAVPSILLVVGVGIAVVSVVNPALGEAVLSGQGYFAQNKLYSTIAEARAPAFSELAMSFGMVTFFLAVAGLMWAIVKIPKNTSPDYILIVVWLGAAIFMAISAGRFMFNAAPAFAIASGWVLVIIVNALNLNEVRKSMAGAGGSYWQILKKSIKIRHVVGALFIGYLVVMTNVWYGFDAGIPSETKSDYDREIYMAMPGFLQPDGYDEINGTKDGYPWYLGAFGYSLPLPTQYFPAAWDWFATQDADVAPSYEKPAYTAWWDYGFEAIDEGKHPSVADNFQQGYQTTGNVIVAQSETDAIAIYSYRLIEVGVRESDQMKADIESLFTKYNISVDRMNEILSGPAQPLIDEILADRETYGPMADDMTAVNARIVAGRTELAGIGLENLVSFYDSLCDLTGWEIRYFNVDSRMFPMSAYNTGIYYAPCKLSDRRIDSESSVPVDFFLIWAVTTTGTEKNPADLGSDDQVQYYKIEYKDMFYDSMFYRAMAGFSASDIGLGDYGIPGYTDQYSTESNPLSNSEAMPGWNLAHFREVYRTAYYNPYPVDQLYMHRNDWIAVSYDEAIELQQQITAGEITGYVDASSSSLYSAGTVFLKYYHGAYVNGTVTTEDGSAAPGVLVTVRDDYQIPHQMVLTDANGSYSILAPFGNVTLVFSTGSISDETLQGASVLKTLRFNVTDDQAMRKPYDFDGDGIMDYEIKKDVVIEASDVEGDVYWDLDRDGNYTSGKDERIPNSIVYATDLLSGAVVELPAADGSLSGKLAPGSYSVSVHVHGQNVSVSDQLNVTADAVADISLGLLPGQLRGIITYMNGDAAAGHQLELIDQVTGYTYTSQVNNTGDYAFTRVLQSRYSLEIADSEDLMIFHVWPYIEKDTLVIANATVQPLTHLSGKIALSGVPVPSAVYTVSDIYAPGGSITGTCDEFGEFRVQVPEGTWSVYASYYSGSEHYAGVTTVSTVAESSASTVVQLGNATRVLGSIRTPTNSLASDTYISLERGDGARIFVLSDGLGTINTRLPWGPYNVTILSSAYSGLYTGTFNVTEDTRSLVLRMTEASVVTGILILETDVSLGPASAIPGIVQGMLVTDSSGQRFMTRSTSDGTFSLVLPQTSSVNVTLANSAYSGWYQVLQYGESTSDITLSAYPDDVVVQGRVSYDGVGLRNVVVSFVPEGLSVAAIEAVTGPEGYYSVPLGPAEYSVVVEQDTNLLGGERYMYQTDLVVSPSGSPVQLDIGPVKRVQMSGKVLGGSSTKHLQLQGPEEISLTLNSTGYSVWILPGSYSAYSTSSLGSVAYANMTSAEVSYDSRTYDFTLTRAYELSGIVMIDASPAGRQATITAVSSSGTEVQVKSTNQGSYSLDLPPGDYEIGYMIETIIREGDRTLYVEYAHDTEISVASDDVSYSPELVMRLDNVTLSGIVLGPSGAPQQALLELVPLGAYGLGVSMQAGSDGRFSGSVQPGDYVTYVRTLQEDSVTLTEIVVARNTPLDVTVSMVEGSSLSGRMTLAGEPISTEFTLTSGPLELSLATDAQGYFSIFLPPDQYSINARLTRTENTMSVLYTLSANALLEDENKFLELPMVRDTKRSVTTSWNRSLTQTGLPNVTATYVFTVTNTGNIEDTYTVSFSGIASEFAVVISPSKLAVGFGTDNQAFVRVNITPSSSVRMGERSVQVSVKSQNSSSTKSDLNLYVNMARIRGVSVDDMESAIAVSSTKVYSLFDLNNTGNAEDTFVVGIGNQETLSSLGWKAEVVSDSKGTSVSAINITAFGSKELYVKFTALRSNPDPSAEASVYAYSKNDTSASVYGAVSIPLPDLELSPGDVTADRDDVTYSRDASSTYVDMGLAIAIGVLVVLLLLLRRKKGLSFGGGKK